MVFAMILQVLIGKIELNFRNAENQADEIKPDSEPFTSKTYSAIRDQNELNYLGDSLRDRTSEYLLPVIRLPLSGMRTWYAPPTFFRTIFLQQLPEKHRYANLQLRVIGSRNRMFAARCSLLLADILVLHRAEGGVRV